MYQKLINNLNKRIMGMRLHSAIKHEVVYSENSDFNWLSDIINPIIEQLAEYDCSYDECEIYYAKSISANRTKLLNNLDKIINPNDEWEFQDDLNYHIKRIEDDGITRDVLYNKLKTLIEQSDNRCENVYFAWF